MSAVPTDPLTAIQFDAPSLATLDQLFPGYKFERFIAKGGMGAVYLATQTSLERQVAIKVLPTEFGDDETFRESFQSEARLMAKLNHPNLIGIYDFGDVDGMLYIIMEFVKGKSLYESAYGKAIVQEKAGEIVRDICLGLDHAHSSGILHRDIKPANILLGVGAQPKIGDFGLARPSANTETGVIYGTPGYAAPEVTAAPDTVDARTDVYSVGVILYELLTGHMPSPDHYESVLVYSDCDPRFESVIDKAIHPDSARRYASAAEMATDINTILADLREHARTAIATKNPFNTPTLATPARTLVPATALTSGQTVRAPYAADTDSQALHPDNTAQTPAPGQIKTSNPAIRNIVIILILLGALAYAWDFKTKKELRIKKEQAIVNAENQRIAKDKELKAQRYRELRALNANANSQPKHTTTGNSGSTTPSVTPKPAPISPIKPPSVSTHAAALEKLALSRSALHKGSRDKSLFPDSVFYRNNDSRALMFVETPMSWAQADQWARQHGGHLASCIGDTDVSELGRRIDGIADEAWLGGGNNGSKGWVWSDGTAWDINATFPATKKRQFVKVNQHGYLGAEDITKALPFYIEWKMNGTNPGSIESRLQRVSRDIENRQINPQFPPGTMSIKTRTYAIINQHFSFDNAYRLASVSGGHLLAISDETELLDLENMLESSAPETHNQLGWLGAEKKNDSWRWITNEQWSPLKWSSGHPNTETRLALRAQNNNITVEDISPTEKTPYFIIEWSNDPERVTTSNNAEMDSASDAYSLTKLQEKAKELLNAQIEETEKQHISNIKRLSFNLGFYIKSLPRSEKLAEQGEIDELIASIENIERLPDDIDATGPSKRVRDYTSYAFSKQQKLETDHADAITKLRTAYRNQLQKLKAAALKAGQRSAASAIDKAIEDTGKTNSEFQAHLGL